MKKVLFICCFITGCSAGIVNKEYVKDELCTYIVNTNGLISIYGKSSKELTKGSFSSKSVPIASLSAEHNKEKQVEKLAEMLDQINSQSYPFLYTALIGRNMQPCNEYNVKKFWETLHLLIKYSYFTRTVKTKKGK